MTDARCARCAVLVPEDDADEWLVASCDGRPVVCPGCVTLEERRAVDDARRRQT